jgi:iron complex transport system substrate-binding protein
MFERRFLQVSPDRSRYARGARGARAAPGLALLVFLVGSALLFAWLSQGPRSSLPEVSPGRASQAGFPREVEVNGGVLRLERAPTRVVPASATAVDVVAALLEPGRVAGFPEQALEYSSLHVMPVGWDRLPRFRVFQAEPVLHLLPDLVVVDPFGAVDTNLRLEEAGVPLLRLPKVRNWEDARAMLVLAGRAFGVEERAEELVSELDARVEALRSKVARRVGLRAVSYSNFGSSGMTAGTETTIDAQLQLCGLVNAASEDGRSGHFSISFEQLLVIDPDLILVSRPLRQAAGPSGDRGGASERILVQEASLEGLRAVREGRIVSLPAWLFATGSHELVAGAEALAAEVDALLLRLDSQADAR